MGEAARLLAVDLGAESGRTVVGTFDGERLTLEEIKRFPNRPVEVGGTLQWDVLRLYADVLDGVRAAGQVDSMGIDTWGVDFGLLDRAGHLLGNPVHYRDRRTQGMLDEAVHRIGREEIYERTGIQFMPINTLYQLLSLVTSRDPQLEAADHPEERRGGVDRETDLLLQRRLAGRLAPLIVRVVMRGDVRIAPRIEEFRVDAICDPPEIGAPLPNTMFYSFQLPYAMTELNDDFRVAPKQLRPNIARRPSVAAAVDAPR